MEFLKCCLVVPVTLETAFYAPRQEDMNLIYMYLHFVVTIVQLSYIDSDSFHGASDFSHEHYLEHDNLYQSYACQLCARAESTMDMHHVLMGTVDRCGYGGQQKALFVTLDLTYTEAIFCRIRLIRCAYKLPIHLEIWRFLC